MEETWPRHVPDMEKICPRHGQTWPDMAQTRSGHDPDKAQTWPRHYRFTRHIMAMYLGPNI